jgi:hypothetical protein
MASMATDPMAAPKPDDDTKLLFCPFCRECYEGERECPEHELPLVDFADLPKQAHEHDLPGWEEPVLPWEPRFGRAEMALGAVAVIVGFFLPIVTGSFDGQAISWSGFDVATGPAKNLWTVPFVGAMFIYLLVRRRTPLQMLGARLVAVALAFMPVVSLAYSLVHVRRGADLAHGALAVEWGVGVWVIGAASLLLLAGGLRFGKIPIADETPHGAEPEEIADEPRIDPEKKRK